MPYTGHMNLKKPITKSVSAFEAFNKGTIETIELFLSSLFHLHKMTNLQQCTCMLFLVALLQVC